MAEFLRANVAHQMVRSVRAAIRVTIEAGHTHAGFFGAAILGCIGVVGSFVVVGFVFPVAES